MPAARSGDSAARIAFHSFAAFATRAGLSVRAPLVKSPVMTTARTCMATSAATVLSIVGHMWPSLGAWMSDSTANDHLCIAFATAGGLAGAAWTSEMIGNDG